jgi:hypothetical protein
MKLLKTIGIGILAASIGGKTWAPAFIAGLTPEKP